MFSMFCVCSSMCDLKCYRKLYQSLLSVAAQAEFRGVWGI